MFGVCLLCSEVGVYVNVVDVGVFVLLVLLLVFDDGCRDVVMIY